MIIFYVKKEPRPIFTTQHLLKENGIEFKEIQINPEHFLAKDILKSAITKMRKAGKVGSFETLAELPIIETDTFALNGTDILKIGFEALIELLQQSTKTKKLRIKRITRKQHETLDLTLENEARINITMLRVANEIDIFKEVNLWPEDQKTAFIIAWRTAQHARAIDLKILADMVTWKANNADPHANAPKHWLGDPDR